MPDILQSNSEPSTTALVKGIIADFQELAAAQLAMFRSEMKEELDKGKEAVVAMCGGIILGLSGVITLCVAIALVLNWIWPEFPLWASFAVVGAIITGAGVCLFLFTKERLASMKPEKTLQSLEENVKWMANK